MQIISKVALITINETILIQLISFLIFLWIINKIMFRPLKETMKERDSYLTLVRHEIQNAEDEIDTIGHQLRDQEKKTRKDAEQIANNLLNQGNQEADKIISEVLVEINRERDRVAKEVSVQLDNARKSLREESEMIAIGIMEKVLGRRLDA